MTIGGSLCTQLAATRDSKLMCLNKYTNRANIVVYISAVIVQFMIPGLLTIPNLSRRDCESVRRSHLQCVTPWSPWVVWLAVVTGGDCWSAPPVPDSATTLPPSSPSSLHWSRPPRVPAPRLRTARPQPRISRRTRVRDSDTRTGVSSPNTTPTHYNTMVIFIFMHTSAC